MIARVDEIRANRNYFINKLRAEKQRNDVLKAVQGEIPFDFVLLDTRGREPFAKGAIFPGHGARRRKRSISWS